MGRPTRQPPPPSYRDDPANADAVSLHTTPDDVPDLLSHDEPSIGTDTLAVPPAYSDDPNSSQDAITTNGFVEDSGKEVANSNNISYRIYKHLDSPDMMEEIVAQWARVAPIKLIQVVGTHTETRKDSNGKESKTQVTDFDVKMRLTEYLFTHPGRSAWAQLRTAQNEDKTYRGTVFKGRMPKPKHISDEERVVELPQPSLKEWCHLYCANPAALKNFMFVREVTNLDEEYLRNEIERLVRSTNYRGHLKITFPTQNAGVMLLSDHFVHRWRYVSWLIFLSVITLLIIFAWPILFFCTKKYQVVKVEWPFAQIDSSGQKLYATISEKLWIQRWAKTLEKAVVSKKQGMLTEEDLASQPEPEFRSGNDTVDSAVSLFSTGVRVFGEVNRQLGWGGDC
jgi:hypothetical protein